MANKKDPKTSINALEKKLMECTNLFERSKASTFPRPPPKEVQQQPGKHPTTVRNLNALHGVQGPKSRLPTWCCSKGVPPLYHQVEKAVTGPQGIDTNLIYPVLLSSGLPKPLLGHIWEICCQTKPGQLTSEELYGALALVALAQAGNQITTIDILHYLKSAPLPLCLQFIPNKEEHHALPQQGVGMYLPGNTAVQPGHVYGVAPYTAWPATSVLPDAITVNAPQTSITPVQLPCNSISNPPAFSSMASGQLNFNTQVCFSSLLQGPHSMPGISNAAKVNPASYPLVTSSVTTNAAASTTTATAFVTPANASTDMAWSQPQVQSLTPASVGIHSSVSDELLSGVPPFAPRPAYSQAAFLQGVRSSSDRSRSSVSSDDGSLSASSPVAKSFPPVPSEVAAAGQQDIFQDEGTDKDDFDDFKSAIGPSSMPQPEVQQVQQQKQQDQQQQAQRMQEQKQNSLLNNSSVLKLVPPPPPPAPSRFSKQPQQSAVATLLHKPAFTNSSSPALVVKTAVSSVIAPAVNVPSSDQVEEVDDFADFQTALPSPSPAVSAEPNVKTESKSHIHSEDRYSVFKELGGNLMETSFEWGGMGDRKENIELENKEPSLLDTATIVITPSPVETIVGDFQQALNQIDSKNEDDDDDFGDFSSCQAPVAPQQETGWPPSSTPFVAPSNEKPTFAVWLNNNMVPSVTTTIDFFNKETLFQDNNPGIVLKENLRTGFSTSKDNLSLAESQSVSSLELGNFESRSSLSRHGSVLSLDLKPGASPLGTDNEDEFGEFESLPIPAEKAPVAVSLSSESLKEKDEDVGGTLYDKYSVIRDATKKQTEDYVDEWMRCLQGCFELINGANVTFTQSPSSQTCQEVLTTEEGTDYIKNVTEVYKVFLRIKLSSELTRKQNEEMIQLLTKIDSTFNQLASFLSNSCLFETAVPKSGESDELPDPENALEACGVCLLKVDQPDIACHKLTYGGRQYHAPCANLWVNCVDSLLPALTLPQLL